MAARSSGKTKAAGAQGASALTGPAPAEAPRTEGQRRLLAVDGSHADLAAKLGATKQAVSYWRRGEKTPGAAARAKLLEAFDIPPSAWESAPEAATRAEAQAPAPPAPTIDPREKLTTLEHTEELIRESRQLRADRNLLPSARARILSDESKLVLAKARLEKERELVEDRIVRDHPAWRRIEERLLAWAKAQGPDVARSLAETLAELA